MPRRCLIDASPHGEKHLAHNVVGPVRTYSTTGIEPYSRPVSVIQIGEGLILGGGPPNMPVSSSDPNMSGIESW